jgi:hypothetical protein
MQPCDYIQIIHSFTNRETGQEEFYDPDHPLARQDGMVMLSRHLISVKLGRWIRPGEIVLYIDGNPQNTDVRNLRLTTLVKLAHTSHGHLTVLYCLICGAPYKLSPSHTLRTSCKNKHVFHNNICRRLALQIFEIDPEELNQLVWEIPITDIANLYGVSNKAIEKRCREFGIPKPPRGYWSKLRNDKGLSQEDQA